MVRVRASTSTSSRAEAYAAGARGSEGGGPAAGRPRRRPWLWVAVAVALLTTTVSWAAGLSLFVSIPVQSHPQLPGGGSVQVTPVNANVLIPAKKPHREAGVELYRIELASELAPLSDQLIVHIGVLNPGEMERLLKKGWIEVGLYRQVESEGDFDLPGGISVARIAGDHTYGRLRASDADLVLWPGLAGDSTIYVVVSVVNSGGNVPPGQQNVDGIDFFLDVRLR